MTERGFRANAPGREAGGVLVIGYGNTLRSDDGVGWHAAAFVDERARTGGDPRLAGVTALARHQLTPELALDLAGAWLAIFVDASLELEPGAIAVRRIDGPAAGNAEKRGARSGVSSHHVGAAELLALAIDLYGRAPEAWEVAVGVASMETGEDLSPVVAAALPAVADAIADLVARITSGPDGS